MTSCLYNVIQQLSLATFPRSTSRNFPFFVNENSFLYFSWVIVRMLREYERWTFRPEEMKIETKRLKRTHLNQKNYLLDDNKKNNKLKSIMFNSVHHGAPINLMGNKNLLFWHQNSDFFHIKCLTSLLD